MNRENTNNRLLMSEFQKPMLQKEIRYLFFVENVRNASRIVNRNTQQRKTLLDHKNNIFSTSDIKPNDALSEQIRSRNPGGADGKLTYWQTTEDYIHAFVDFLAFLREKFVSNNPFPTIEICFVNPREGYNGDVSLGETVALNFPNWTNTDSAHAQITQIFDAFQIAGDRWLSFNPNNFFTNRQKTVIYAFSSNPDFILMDLVKARKNLGIWFEDKAANFPITAFPCCKVGEGWMASQISKQFTQLDEEFSCLSIARDFQSTKRILQSNHGKEFEIFREFYETLIYASAMPENQVLDDLDESVPLSNDSYQKLGLNKSYNQYFALHPWGPFIYDDAYNELLTMQTTASKIIDKNAQNKRKSQYYAPIPTSIMLLLAWTCFISYIAASVLKNAWKLSIWGLANEKRLTGIERTFQNVFLVGGALILAGGIGTQIAWYLTGQANRLKLYSQTPSNRQQRNDTQEFPPHVSSVHVSASMNPHIPTTGQNNLNLSQNGHVLNRERLVATFLEHETENKVTSVETIESKDNASMPLSTVTSSSRDSDTSMTERVGAQLHRNLISSRNSTNENKCSNSVNALLGNNQYSFTANNRKNRYQTLEDMGIIIKNDESHHRSGARN